MSYVDEATDSDITKMKLNHAVMKFYQTGGKNHETLLQELVRINNEEPKLSKCCTVLYNIAVIYFHRQMYFAALDILHPLMDRLDSMDISIAAPVGILYLRLLIETHHVNRALAFAEVLQHKVGININDNFSHDATTSAPETIAGSAELARAFRLLSTMALVLSRKSVVIPEESAPEYSALKAHQYYIMKDFQLAAKQLRKINDEDCKHYMSNDLGTCVANNMGVIHLRVRHYAIAAKFFQNALFFDKHVSANLRSTQLQNMSTARSCEILYNLGISMLHLRRPKEAFQCLLVPLKSYPSNARLWFRIAEACIMDHEIKDVELERSSLAILLAAAGKRRKLILKQKPRVLYTDQPPAVPESSLEFASLCLRNALMLVTAYKNEYSEEKTNGVGYSGNWSNVRDNNFCNPSKSIPRKSLDNMLSAVYAAYSYVLLNIGDYVRALEMAQELLKQERLSDSHKMLAHMYVAEALILLDRPHQEARPHLEQHLEHLNAFDFETKDWQVKSVDAAQNVVRYNLAVATALQGDIETASALLSSCKHPIVAPKVVALKMHIELKKVT